MVKNTRKLWYSESMFGIAFDLGTTSIAAYLCDLETKKVIKTISCLNEQIKYGADIISRITYGITTPDGRYELQNTLGEQIVSIVKGFDEKISDLLMVGNPVIIGSIADYDFGKALSDNAINVYGLPAIGNYAGADALAGSYMVEIERNHENALLIDIGTNGEIVLLTDKVKLSTTAAAGPALEGGNVTFGMRGEAGAIDKIEVTKLVNGEKDIIIHVIDEIAPRGMCGSGLLSLLQRLIELKVIDENGYMLSRSEALAIGVSNKIAARIIDEESKDNNDKTNRYFKVTGLVKLYQEDIRALQLAKSALRTGAQMLLDEAGLKLEDLNKIYLAGAFGNKITVESALKTGLLLPVPEERIIQAGNLAGIGAYTLLMNQDKLKDVYELNDKIESISLADREEFKELFMKNMAFFK